MHRCLQLAALARGNTAPNPVVGSVLVYDGRIIGEGYHQQYGKAHAEANCIASVREEDRHLISGSTLYVSLEPCAHFGKTPPCAALIVDNKIQRVVVGCRDPFSQVNGKGIAQMQAAGIEVIVGILEERCRELNNRFFTCHTQHRPFVLLKWAQTADNRMAGNDSSPLKISNEFTNRLVHRWRSEEMAIVVGTNTAMNDDPQLNTRLWPGKNPVRIVADMGLRLPASLRVFDGSAPTVVFNSHRHTLPFEKLASHELKGVQYYQVTEDASLPHQMLNGLYGLGIQSVLVEGGAQLLQSFIDEGLWDEARVITNSQLVIGNGLPAPRLLNADPVKTETVFADVIRFYVNAVDP